MTARAAFKAAESFDVEPPRPLRRPARSSAPYPVAALGDELAATVNAAVAIVQVPDAMAAQSVLSVLALAAQAHIDVSLPTGSTSPVSLNLLSVGGSGDRKSTLDKLLGWPIDAREKALGERFKIDAANYGNEKEAWDAARTRAKGGKIEGRDAIADALQSCGSEPAPPRRPIITAPDPTVEGMHKLFDVGQPSMGLFSDEGGSFIGGFGMTKEREIATAAQLSKLWDGATIKRVRGGDGASMLRGRRMSMHLMLQPKLAAGWLANSGLRDQGLFSRLLIVAPDTLAGKRFHRDVPDADHATVRRFQHRVLSLLELPAPVSEDDTAALDPRKVGMTPKAKAAFWSFYDKIEAHVGPGGRLEPVRSLANKIGEHAARLAAVLAIYRNPDVSELTEHDLAPGIALALWYLEEALRLADAGTVSDEVAHAEELLAWLRDKWPAICAANPSNFVSLPDIYQRGPNAIREKATAAAIVAVLVDHGWLTPVPGRHRVNGHVRRADVFAIVEEAR